MRIRLHRRVRITILTLLVFIASFAFFPYKPGLAAGNNWPQFDFDAQHSGNNPLEVTITPANVNQLVPLFQVTLPRLPGSISAVADGAPAYLSGVTTPGGVKDLAFVTTKGADLIALDAHTGAVIWTASHPAPAPCTATSGGNCYTTSSPVIDPNLTYVYSYGLDGRVHKHQVSDGTEVTTGGWPELATLKVPQEKGSSALSLASANGTTYLYVTNGGYPGDAGDYQGHVTAIDLGTGAQHVFNTLCSNQTVHFVLAPGSPDCGNVQAAIWARAGTVYDAALNKLFTGTGNGNFDVPNFDWGDSILALNPNGTATVGGTPLDSYTPTNFVNLQSTDADLGSTLPAILPIPPGTVSNVANLAVQSGKDAKLRLINLANLSGSAVPGPGNIGGEISVIGVPQGGEVLTQPAVWVNPADHSTWVFVANDNGISGLKLTFSAGVPSLAPQWQHGGGGTSPIIANNVLYYAGGGNIQALNPTTGTQLWTSTSTATNIGGIHWESPIVMNGVLYITDESAHVTAYWLGVVPTPTPTSSPVATSAPPAGSGSAAGGQIVAQTSFDPAISKVGSLQPGGLGLPGEKLTWTITVVNQGALPGNNVTVNDTLPGSLRMDGADSSQGTFSVGGQTVTFNIGTLNPGQTVTLHIFTTVLSSTNTISNTACVSATTAFALPNPRCATGQITPPTRLPSTGYPPAEGLSARGLIFAGVGALLLVAGVSSILLGRRRE